MAVKGVQLSYLQKVRDQSLYQRILQKLRTKQVQAHLLRAQKKVNANTEYSTLNDQQKKNRENRLKDLKEYIYAKKYPINDVFRYKTPLIKDNYGNLCAMAYLVQQSGYPEVVDQLDQEGREFRIDKFKNPLLPIWLEKQGLTLQEAKLIQPAYGPRVPQEVIGTIEPDIKSPLRFITIIFHLLLLTIITLTRGRGANLKTHHPKSYEGSNIIPAIGVILLAPIILFPIGTSSYYDPPITIVWEFYLIHNAFSTTLLTVFVLVSSALVYASMLLRKSQSPMILYSLVLASFMYLPAMIYLFLVPSVSTNLVTTSQISGETLTPRIDDITTLQVTTLTPGVGFLFLCLHVVILTISTYLVVKKVPKPANRWVVDENNTSG